MIQRIRDYILECRIHDARLMLSTCEAHQKRARWQNLCDLVAKRSPEQVARMEKRMRLA